MLKLRQKDEGRLYYKDFPNDWMRYNTKQVVFEPKKNVCRKAIRKV